MRRRLNQGFNLVEILITLTLIALLTTTLINFVNDFDDKTKVARARNDLMRMAQQAVIAESKAGAQVSTASAAGSSIMTLLLDYLVELPDYDPWGNRFVISDDGTVVSSATQGQAYIVDPSFGRMICAGPDGIINTELGQGNADTDNDIVIEFRQQPWVAYSYTPNGSTIGEVWVARLDGSSQGKVLPHPTFEGGASGVVNVTFSPDGNRWAGVKVPFGTNEIVWGNSSAVNPVATAAADPIPGLGIGVAAVGAGTYPMFLPDGNQILWITNNGALWVHNIVTERTDQLLPDLSVHVDDPPDPADTQGRIVFSSRERSYYWRVGTGTSGGADSKAIGIAASSDGKIAVNYYAGSKKGIFMVLPGSSSRRLLKETVDAGNSLDNWMPMFWEDSNDLIYWAKGTSNANIVRRIAQDGRFDIPLYKVDAGTLGNRNPVLPSISPDGRLIYFIYAASNQGIVVRADGGGYFKGNFGTAGVAPAGMNPVPFQPVLWAPDGGSFHVTTFAGGSAGLFEVNLRTDSPALAPQASPPTFNTQFNATPIRAALSPNGLMIAAVTKPGEGSPQEPGVFIFPILGPETLEGTKVTISSTEPAGDTDNLPNITWIDN